MTEPSFVVELETLRHLQGPVRPVGELSRRGIAAWRQGSHAVHQTPNSPAPKGQRVLFQPHLTFLHIKLARQKHHHHATAPK